MNDPFEDIRSLILGIQPPLSETDESGLYSQYGRLSELGRWYRRHTRHSQPRIDKQILVIFAATHGNANHAPALHTHEDVVKIVADIGNGDAVINQLCQAHGVGLQVFELALEKPTADFTHSPAMNEAEWAATFAYGMESLASEPDLLAIGSVSDGGITSAAALYTALFGGGSARFTPRLHRDSDADFERRCACVEAALARHADVLGNPLRILQALGGREITAIAGAIIAARYQKTPVILDGFVSTAAAAVLAAVSPEAIAHCQYAHVSPWQAHKLVLYELQITPVFTLNMEQDIGAGAAIAACVTKGSISPL